MMAFKTTACIVFLLNINLQVKAYSERFSKEDVFILGGTNSTCDLKTPDKFAMKRTQEVCGDMAKKRIGNWSLGLIESITNPELVVKKSEKIVVIKDKYPKAKYHYLIIPQENISSIFKLNKSHVELLEEFGTLYEQLASEHPGVKLRAGFHAVPSMQRLHMHVISNDMVSPCLKTKQHWNSFTTTFFIPYNDLLENLKTDGKIQRISPEKHKELLSTPIKCNQCDYEPKNIPQLKEHLLKHL